MTTPLVVSEAPTATVSGKLHLFSLYLDFPASVQARALVCAITKLAGPEWQTSSEMWKLEAFKSSANIRQMMTRDAANADILILSITSLTHREPALIEWLTALAAQKTNQAGLLIGLLGDDHTQPKELDWVVLPLIRHSRQMGRAAIWHCLSENTVSTADWLAEDLENVLARKRGAQEVLATPHI